MHDVTQKFLAILVALSLCGQLAAQSSVSTFIKKVGTFIDTMSVKGVDRRYIDIPEEPWQLHSNLRITPVGEETFNSGMTVNFDARLSLTYNFGRYFVNACGQFNNIRYRYEESHGHLNDWYVNTSVDIRL